MIELLIVACLILLNGLFALSELAIVSARIPRLKALAASGRPGAERAIALAADPGKFLSAVQVGITLIGIINGAYSGETFGEQASEALRISGIPPAIAQPLGYGGVIAIITYLSVIIGELVPKNLALRNAEAISCLVAPLMTVLSRLLHPAVWLLDASTRLVFALFGQVTESESRVTDEEIRTLIAEAENAGVLETGEREMIAGVMRLADRGVVGLMTPRTEVDLIDLQASDEETRGRLIKAQHSLLPVVDGEPDLVVGVVQTRAVLSRVLDGAPLDIAAMMRKSPMVPETMDALAILPILRAAEVPMAIVLDEYGHFQGIVTPTDVLEAIAGVFRSDAEDREPYATERADGSWLLSGAMPADEMADKIGITLPKERAYETVAGFVLSHLKQLPQTGEATNVGNWRFEVVDLDGRRIDKVLASKLNKVHRQWK